VPEKMTLEVGGHNRALVQNANVTGAERRGVECVDHARFLFDFKAVYREALLLEGLSNIL
jgi:hypothetical protein